MSARGTDLMTRASSQHAEAIELVATVTEAELGAQGLHAAIAHQGEHLAALKRAVG